MAGHETTADSSSDDAPKLHIDSDWKAEAQAEKERLAEAEKNREPKEGAKKDDPRGIPEPTFTSLIGILASQALMGLGTMQDPQSGGIVIDLEGSRFSIDLLGVLEEKTAGNLSEEEEKELKQIASELRNRYVQVAQLVAQQAASGDLKSVPGAVPGAPISPGAGSAGHDSIPPQQ